MSKKNSSNDNDSSATQQEDPEMHQLRELEKWNNLKKSQAEKKIMEHLLFSGPRKEEKDQPRTRLRKKKNLKGKQTQEKSKPNTDNKDYDIESIVRSIEGGSYKQPKKNNKKKKRKRKGKGKATTTKKNNSTAQEPVPKTEAERSYSKVAVSGENLAYKLKQGLTIIGRIDRPGFRIPELNVQFECSLIQQAEQHVFLSSTDKQYVYGLPYSADNSQFISCSENQFDRLVSFVQSWRELQGAEPIEQAPEDDDEASPLEAGNENSPEAEEEVEPSEGEEEGEEELVWVSFSPGSSLEYPEVGGYVHAYESAENCLAYCFSKEEDPRRYNLVYTSKTSAAFFRKYPSLLKSDVFMCACSLEEESENEQIPWKHLQTLVLAHPDTKFVITFPSSSPDQVFPFFDSLLQRSTDLSNVVLFLPPIDGESEKAAPSTENQV